LKNFSSYVAYDLSQTVRKSFAVCKGTYDLLALSHFNAIIWHRRPRAPDTFQQWATNGLQNKILKSAVKFIDSPNLTLLTRQYFTVNTSLSLNTFVN